jgi:hypothetical protein
MLMTLYVFSGKEQRMFTCEAKIILRVQTFGHAFFYHIVSIFLTWKRMEAYGDIGMALAKEAL